tara:strand:- start:1 stop:1209 length:1209 start_codon:yes stop_codon:yes gene_type:complete
MAKDLISFADLMSGTGGIDALGSAIRKAAAPSDKFVGKNTFKARILRRLGSGQEMDPQVMQNMQGLPAGEQSRLRGKGYQGYYIQILEDSPHAFLPDPCPQGEAGTANVAHNQLLQSMYTTALYSGEVLHGGCEVLVRMEKKGFSYDTDIAYIVDVIGSNAARNRRQGNSCAQPASSAYGNQNASPGRLGVPYSGKNAGGDLLAFIGSGEGTYNSMNQGTSGNSIIGFTHNASTILPKNLTEMTIAEVLQHQAAHSSIKGTSGTPPVLFAAGRYQIVPVTMLLALAETGISRDTLFNAATQDKLGSALLYGTKRPTLAAYLEGRHDNIEAAQLDFAREWASVPSPGPCDGGGSGCSGRSYYGGANKSSHSNEQVQKALRAEREKNIATAAASESEREENLRA